MTNPSDPEPQPSITPSPETRGYQFGTFKGVFTPSILTILGVIMYLRFGWVLGNVGLPLTLLIVTMACSITFLTGLSIAAMATNMKIGAGGAYFMLSRSFGLEAGAAIGIPLFFAQALGIAFYVTGFSESVVDLFPMLDPKMVGVVTLLALTALAYKSADLALKSQFVILAFIALSLISFFMGGTPSGIQAEVVTPPITSSFWVVFAVFFPAVTGIEAGIAMSGDLKNPARSLPVGTIGAVITGYAVYLAIPIFLNSVVHDRNLLLTDTLIMRQVARFGHLVILGLWGASLSSAMGSLLGAPRTLQALARDGILPRFLGKGYGKGDDPRVATAVAFGLATATILAGDLNMIAPVLSMFFLTSYGLLNTASALEQLIGSPSWRPTFRIPWFISAAGAIGCLAVMLMINAGATIIAVIITSLIYTVMQRRRLSANWGDIRYGILMLIIQNIVYRLSGKVPDERTWRPNILVLSGVPTTRWYLIELADAIAHGNSLLTVATVLPPEGQRVRQVTETIQNYLDKQRVTALVKIVRAPTPLQGAYQLVQTYGFGPIFPNTILIGETERTENMEEYAILLNAIHRNHKNVIIVREGRIPPTWHQDLRIDVWWGRERKNANFMLALAYLLETSRAWRHAHLVLNTIVTSPDQKEEAERTLSKLIEAGRIEAEPVVHVSRQDEVFNVIREASRGSNLVFLGIRPPDRDETTEAYAAYYQSLIERTEDFPPLALVMAAESIEFHRIFRA
ncbi:MAG TPA: amino acid permease [Thermoanaerobaculia bacterium]|nr:amino acid permease [Thermoanaerobaculia bacterium]HUM30259.1 amino acid permease [Thermoanaerobaculia bacterium]HXK68445.1 amino acid permease [Thermoanaerobaculia bacterium]